MISSERETRPSVGNEKSGQTWEAKSQGNGIY